MMLVNGLPKPGAHDVCVDLGGGNVGMAEHGLDAAKIGAPLQQMSSEAVPQNVGTQIVKNSGGLPVDA